MITIVDPLIHWPIEFAKVIRCAKCSKATDPNLMRDSDQHVPQPGYIGEGYGQTGLLLVGQNPGLPNVGLAAQDRDYTAALRALRDAPTEQQYARLQVTLYRFIQKWSVQNNYFPLMEFGLSLKDIAYLNLVRCRTGDKAPNANTVKECRRTHFEPWLEMLNPTCVVFIGRWACEQGRNAVAARRIPYATIDRNRSLNSSQRIINRTEVAGFVRENLRSPRVTASGSTGILPSAYRPRPAQNNEMEVDPKRTLALLDELQKLGFNDEAFWRLHHFRREGRRATIAPHRAYCEKISAFRPDGTNERVQRRLAFVLKTYREPGNTKNFIMLADAAFDKIPAL
jgi:uracil-DNA glycosylase